MGRLFVVHGSLGTRPHPLTARAVLVAVGLQDDIPGWARPWYGRLVHHCSDCDGPSYVDRTVLVTGEGPGLGGFVLHLRRFAARVIVVSPRRHPSEAKAGEGVSWIIGRIVSARAGGRSDPLVARLASGGQIACHGAFFLSRWTARLGPLESLRLETRRGDLVHVDRQHRTSVRGVFAAGDVTHGSQLAIVAAAEGAMAALSLDAWLDDPLRHWKEIR